jgi:hypothetical protein
MGVHGPSSCRVHVAAGKRFGISAPGGLEGKDPCPHDSRNPDIRDPEITGRGQVKMIRYFDTRDA